MADSVGVGFPNNINSGHIHYNNVSGLLWQYISGRPFVELNWKPIGGATATDPSIVGWAGRHAGSLWFNTSERVWKSWNGTELKTLSLTTDDATKYKTSIFIEDDFLTGAITSNQIGSLGWATVNGAANSFQALTGAPGVIRRDTSAVSGTICPMFTNCNLVPIPHTTTWRVSLTVPDSLTTVRIGENNGVTSNPSTSGVYFEKLDADLNWFAVCRNGGAQTRVDTGLQVTAGMLTFMYVYTATLVTFFIEGTLVASILTNIPATNNFLLTQIINGEAAAKTLDHDYFSLNGVVTR